jgi:hypothetical protein
MVTHMHEHLGQSIAYARNQWHRAAVDGARRGSRQSQVAAGM